MEPANVENRGRPGKYDIPSAIALKQIPTGTEAYKAAQEQIKLWQLFLNPLFF